jgi:ATP-dependent helicase/DNAse subunit B
MVTTAMQCEYKYKLQYIDKMKSGKPDSAPMNFGSALHTAINSVLEGDTDPLLTFNAYWDALKDKELAYARSNWEQYKELGEVYLSRFTRLHAPKLKLHKCEERIGADLMGVRVEGTPDFVGYYEDTPCVLDFKTSSKPYDKTKLYTHPQLYLYAHLVDLNYEFKATHIGYIVFVSHPEPRIQTIIEPIEPKIMYEMLETFGKWSKRLAKAKDFPKNNMGCTSPYLCDYRQHCWPQG